MTEPQPYTEADVPVLVSQMGGSSVGRQVAQERMIATVRAYQRVLAENEKLSAEVAALREDKERLEKDAARWRVVRGELAIFEETHPILGIGHQYWRFIGRDAGVYYGPAPTTLDEAADRLIDAAREGGEGEQ